MCQFRLCLKVTNIAYLSLKKLRKNVTLKEVSACCLPSAPCESCIMGNDVVCQKDDGKCSPVVALEGFQSSHSEMCWHND